MKTRILQILGLMMVLGLVLAACQPQVKEDEPATIDFWFATGRGRDAGVAAVAEAFQAIHPHITVNYTAYPFGEFHGAVAVALASDEPPDLFFEGGAWTESYAYSGALLPLDDIYTEEDLGDFLPGYLDLLTYEGKLYGAPFQSSAGAMWYNVDQFEAAGVEAPSTLEEGWTWPEFVENVNKVREHQASLGNEVYGMVGFSNPLRQLFFAGQILRTFSAPGDPGWELIAEDLSTVRGFVDSDEAMEAYEFFQSIYADGFSPMEDIPDAFETGKAVTDFTIPASGGGFAKNWPDLNFDAMPLPYMKTPLTHLGGILPMVTAKTDNPDEAKLFAQYFTSKEGYTAYHNVSPTIPARLSLVAELEGLQSGHLDLLFQQMVEWGHKQPGGPAKAILIQVIGNNLLPNIGLGGDIEAEVEAAIQEVDAQLTQFQE